MLNDWLWSLLFVFCVWLQALACALIIGRRLEFSWSVRLGVSFAFLSQFYFIASLVGLNSPIFHFTMVALAAVLVFKTLAQNPAKLHLKLARFVSPLSWAQVWPWLVLPFLWLVVRTIDALIPHNDWLALTVNLDAAHRWLEQGGQKLNPLNAFAGAASLWDALYFHIQVLTHSLTTTHQTALSRAHIAAQLLHFTAGLLLALVLLAEFIAPVIKSSVKRTNAILPIALALAWMSCAQDPMTKAGIVARSDWSAFMLVCVAAHLATRTHFALAWFCWGTAFAMNQAVASTSVGLVALCLLYRMRRADVVFSLFALATSVASWGWRQLTQAGEGWLTSTATNALQNAMAFEINGFILQIEICLALLALAYGISKSLKSKTLRFSQWSPVLVFILVNLISALLASKPTLSRAVLLVFSATLGTYFLFNLVASRVSPKAVSAVPYVWFLIALVSVPIPFHVMWQHLSLAATPTSRYLEQELLHFTEKHWASVHLAPEKKLVWPDDSQFYYLTQQATSISATSALREPLLRAVNPKARTKILCDLGFDVLAWPSHSQRPSPELMGIASWLKVSEAPILYTSENLMFFELKCDEL